jgi:hypothetical protein
VRDAACSTARRGSGQPDARAIHPEDTLGPSPQFRVWHPACQRAAAVRVEGVSDAVYASAVDPGMNFTLNRPLMDGTSQARIAEIGAVASQLTNYQSWHDVWLMLAKRAESEQRWLDAASY